MEVTEQMAQVTQSKDKNVQLSLYSEQAGKLKIIPPLYGTKLSSWHGPFQIAAIFDFLRKVRILHLA